MQEKKHKEVQKLELKAQKKRGGAEAGGVPEFVRECVRVIEASGMDEEGLYRMQGSRPEVDALNKKWRKGTAMQGANGAIRF